MTLRDELIDRAARLLVARLLADESGKPNAKPLVDADGDIHCPDCPDRVFVTKRAYHSHRTKTHHDPSYKVRSGRGDVV